MYTTMQQSCCSSHVTTGPIMGKYYDIDKTTTLPEMDRASATDNTQRKFGEVRPVDREICMQTDRQTDRQHTHHTTSVLCQGVVIISMIN